MNFDIDQLEPGIAAEGEEVAASLLIAYSQAISIRRIADLLEQMATAPAPHRPIGEIAEQVVTMVRRGGAKAPGVSKAMPVDFTAWGGEPRIENNGGANKLVTPADPLASVIVWYRRGKSSNPLSAGTVNWTHSGGLDDVLGYRVIGQYDGVKE